MKRTGELLRKAREEKGLSVHEVSMFLKINTRILQAIEEGNQANLPAKTFLRGFVQSYAKFLKIDVQEVLQVFTEETSPHPAPQALHPGDGTISTASSATPEDVKLGMANPSSTFPEYPEETAAPAVEDDPLKNSVLAKASQPPDTLRIRTIAISLVSLLLVFIIYFANSVIKKYQREAELAPDMVASLPVGTSTVPTVSAPPLANASEGTQSSEVALVEDSKKNEGPQTNSSTTPPTERPMVASGSELRMPTPTPIPTPTPVPAPTLKPQSATPALISSKPTSAPALAPSPAAKPSVTPPAAPTVAPKPAVTPAQVPAPTASTITTGPARLNTVEPTTTTTSKPAEGRLVEVIVEAKQNVEIEYSSTRSRPQRLTLRGDQIHTFKSRSGVRLKISNGGAVNVIVNGRDLGVPGVVGQPVQLAYD